MRTFINKQDGGGSGGGGMACVALGGSTGCAGFVVLVSTGWKCNDGGGGGKGGGGAGKGGGGDGAGGGGVK